MNFKKVFRGYSPKQVDKHIAELTQKHEQIRLAQKQYLEELTEENYQLRHKVKQYELDEQAVAKTLIESQKLADELKNDAVHFSEVVLSRAFLRNVASVCSNVNRHVRRRRTCTI